MYKKISHLLQTLAALGASFAITASAIADSKYNFQDPASPITAAQHELHNFVLIVSAVICVVVFGAMFYSIYYHRKSRGYKAAQFHDNFKIEVIWTIIPAIIVIALAYPATVQLIYFRDTSSPDMTIKVTGYQWKWGYDYLDTGISILSQLSTAPGAIGGKFYNSDAAPDLSARTDEYLLEVDNELVVPINKKIRLLLTAADVIHAWWVPALGVKQDAVPGLVRDAWFIADKPGVYRGQCAELCGKNHGFMPIVVKAVSQEDYDTWVIEQGGIQDDTSQGPIFAGAVQVAQVSSEPEVDLSLEQLMEKGKAVYQTNCAACHQPNGAGLPPAFPSLIKSEIIISESPAKHIDVVLNGEAGTAMASFSYLSNTDLAAVITYERNAWGNDTGDIVQPSDIADAR